MNLHDSCLAIREQCHYNVAFFMLRLTCACLGKNCGFFKKVRHVCDGGLGGRYFVIDTECTIFYIETACSL